MGTLEDEDHTFVTKTGQQRSDTTSEYIERGCNCIESLYQFDLIKARSR